jgi:hypothetical protein
MTDTLSETLNALRQQGYTEDFNLHENHLKDSKGHYKFFPNDFHIDKVYRFDGMTDPADETVLYAISSKKQEIRGVLVNGYGIYSEPMTDEMLLKLT